MLPRFRKINSINCIISWDVLLIPSSAPFGSVLPAADSIFPRLLKQDFTQAHLTSFFEGGTGKEQVY